MLEAHQPISYTIDDARRVTGLGRSSIYKLMAEGHLAKVKVGRRTLIGADSLRQLIAGGADKIAA